MKYTFQYFLDISTSANSVSIVKIKAGGEYVRERCKHLFNAYKYWKLGTLSVKLIPASTLPVDPTGLSYDVSDPQSVDPRDQLSPGLVRITNGENIFTHLNSLSDEEMRQMYTNTMLDPRWSKFMLQSGFHRSAVPLAWDVGNLEQSAYPDMVRNLPYMGQNAQTGEPCINDTFREADYYASWDGSDIKKDFFVPGSDGRGLFQLGHKKRLGWLPTDAFQEFYTLDSKGGQQNGDVPLLNPIPEIDCITFILPKAFKTLYYYRLFVTETVYFSGVKNVGIVSNTSGTENEYRAFDNFTFCNYPLPLAPNVPMERQTGVGKTTYTPGHPNDGGS